MAEERDTFNVDINDLSLETAPMVVDAEADAFRFPPPPPKGIYPVRLALQNAENLAKAWSGKAGNDGAVRFLWCKLELRVTADGPYKDRPMFDQASTMVMQSSNTSKVAGILKELGKAQDVAQCKDHREIAKLFTNVLSGGPECEVQIDWEARRRKDDNTYETVCRGMDRFPPLLDENGKQVLDANGKGRKSHIYVFTDPKTKITEDVPAQVNIIRYMKKKASASAADVD